MLRLGFLRLPIETRLKKIRKYFFFEKEEEKGWMYVRYVLKGITRNNRKGGKGERRVIEGGVRSY